MAVTAQNDSAQLFINKKYSLEYVALSDNHHSGDSLARDTSKRSLLVVIKDLWLFDDLDELTEGQLGQEKLPVR